MTARPLTPVIDISFWQAAFALKLDRLGLSRAPVAVWGCLRHSRRADAGALLHLDAQGLAEGEYRPRERSFHELRLRGRLVLLNSARELREAAFEAEDGVAFVLAAHLDHKAFEALFAFWELRAAAGQRAGLGPAEPLAVAVEPELVRRSEGFELAGQSALGAVVSDALGEGDDAPGAWLLERLRRARGAESRFALVRGAVALGAAGERLQLRTQPLVLPAPAAQLRLELHATAPPRALALRGFLAAEDLTAQAQQLHLKLMKWRLEPALDLALLARQRVLVLGTGTLGCNLARALLGYGLTAFTFVDHGAVGAANLLRQSLFTAEELDAPKAEAACRAVLRVCPGARVRAERLRVPMPGHFLAEERADAVLADLQRLEQLVDEHDLVLNVFDSREARYFPTLLAALHGRLCVSLGIGYDSFVAVIHPASAAPQPGQPGCFFCTDCLPPSDTLTDRAMDQQCTVARPGVSLAAAGFCAEMVVNHLHGGAVGPAPCFVRGALGGEFSARSFTGERFESCVACGAAVLARYARDRRAFLLAAMNDPRGLARDAGLAADEDDGAGEAVLFSD